MYDSTVEGSRGKVVIVGAGIGGLTLGVLLEKAGIPYVIVERNNEVKRYGAPQAFGCNVMGLFRQLRMEEDFLAHAKPTLHLEVFNEDMESILRFENKNQKATGGSHMYIIPRPDLIDMLVARIPPHKFEFGKRVLKVIQGDNGAQVNLSNKKYIEGNIIVGCDGANSSVRQNIYERLCIDHLLPPEDKEGMPYKSVSVVGQTSPLDVREYNDLLLEDSPFQCVIGQDGFSWTTFTTKNNTICWNIVLNLNKHTKKYHNIFTKSDWGPEDAKELTDMVMDCRIPNGSGNKTLGDLIACTPKKTISKIMLQEKVYSTWYSGRAVLMGNACHKMNPAGGMGAILAMHDAIALANWLNVIPYNPTVADLEYAFREYQDERMPYVIQGFKHSQSNSRITASSSKGHLNRKFFKLIPKFIMAKYAVAMVRNRPWVSFLPDPPDSGSVARDKQFSFWRTRQLMEANGLPIITH
ncbi:hypothetical protein BGZ94_001724 [Podila epigama]|nr:hypothetical protein BGZ94_001724 [Podila epigama]